MSVDELRLPRAPLDVWVWTWINLIILDRVSNAAEIMEGFSGNRLSGSPEGEVMTYAAGPIHCKNLMVVESSVYESVPTIGRWNGRTQRYLHKHFQHRRTGRYHLFR